MHKYIGKLWSPFPLNCNLTQNIHTDQMTSVFQMSNSKIKNDFKKIIIIICLYIYPVIFFNKYVYR